MIPIRETGYISQGSSFVEILNLYTHTVVRRNDQLLKSNPLSLNEGEGLG